MEIAAGRRRRFSFPSLSRGCALPGNRRGAQGAPRLFPALFLLLCLLISAPLLILFMSWLTPGDAAGFAYLADRGLLGEYTANSLALALLTVIPAMCAGGGAAWIVTMYSFPGRTFFAYASVFPLAVPSYAAAMIYARLLEGAGPLQTALRDVTGLAFGEYWFPEIRSTGGAAFVLACTLYPYVYVTARAGFLLQSRRMLETGTLLGYGEGRLFFSLTLPLARPALIAGGALVAMEALADYGVAALYGVPVFTTGIYRAWQGMYDPLSAARLASVLLLFVLLLVTAERMQRGGARYANTTGLFDRLPRRTPGRAGNICAFLFCALPFAAGFLLPAGMMLFWAVSRPEAFARPELWRAAGNSVMIAGAAACIASALALCCAYRLRRGGGAVTQAAVTLATSGYAAPGAVVAAGILLLFLALDRVFPVGGAAAGASVAGLVWACSFRFLAAAFNATDACLKQVTTATDDAAYMLGAGNPGLFFRVHLPLLKAGVPAGFLLVFVDTLKELPASLLLRPFDFDTLAIRAYELAGDELLERAAPSALLLILAGMLPVWYISRRTEEARPGGAATEAARE